MTENRCDWCHNDLLYIQYHDDEWGVPCYDDKKLFEFLILEGAQAGLNWITILRRRPAYATAFCEWNVHQVASMTEQDVKALMQNEGVIRNRLKILSAINNAKAFIAVQDEFGSFANYLWGFVNYQPIQNHFASVKEVPAETDISQRLSEDLKKRGFKFVGPTICYAYMQSMGLVNDHILSCPARDKSAMVVEK